MKKNFKLIQKIKLTNNIFELHYISSENFSILAWQFITFILPNIWVRAYSILKKEWNKIILIIKKENAWKWWSIFLCDSKIWDKFELVWPMWKFNLKEKDNNKLFIWTGTGLVPLYNQIITGLKRWDKSKYTLLFGSKIKQELFYINNFKKISKKYSNFDYKIYLSREKQEWFEKWYITDFLDKKNIHNFDEFYICGILQMINSSIEILKQNWVKKENIFFEKY